MKEEKILRLIAPSSSTSLHPLVCAQLLHPQIPKAQKAASVDYLFALLGSAHVKAESKILVKLTPPLFINYQSSFQILFFVTFRIFLRATKSYFALLVCKKMMENVKLFFGIYKFIICKMWKFLRELLKLCRCILRDHENLEMTNILIFGNILITVIKKYPTLVFVFMRFWVNYTVFEYAWLDNVLQQCKPFLRRTTLNESYQCLAATPYLK